MARRELEEINAGSMADIAFLLLIFFIVTTTMDLEAGMAQTLPIKTEVPDDLPPVNDRDIFSINVNSNDGLLVEKESAVIEELEELLYRFYTANLYTEEADISQARYFTKEKDFVKQALAEAKVKLIESEDDIFVKSKVIKLQKTLAVCEVMPDGKFLEINETATIQLKQQSGTSYGIYIKILNVIDRTIFKVRDEKCKEVFNGIAYSDLDIEIPSDLEKKKIIDILIPKRLLEPEITN